MLALIKGHSKIRSEQHFSRTQRALSHRKKGTFENLGGGAWPSPVPTDTDTDISQHTPYQGFSVTGYIMNR